MGEGDAGFALNLVLIQIEAIKLTRILSDLLEPLQ